jgi:Transposase DDE domain
VNTATSKATVWQQLRQRDLRAFQHIFTPRRIADAAARVGLAVGTSPLNLANLLWLALACAWHKGRSFADVLGLFLKALRDAPGWAHDPLRPLCEPRADGPPPRRPRHDPRGGQAGALSEEAFAQARPKLSPWLVDCLLMLLADDFERAYPGYARWKGLRLLALDGTTVRLPHWPALAEHFGRQGNGGRGRPCPAARLVLLNAPRTRLPWRYELTPLAEHERAVAARLLDRLRPDDLVLLDKGFFSYGLFWQVHAQGAFFATRLKAGVRLRALRQLGPGDRLVRWAPADRRKAWAHLPEALDLRVIDYQVKGFRPSAVLTNLLDEGRVSRPEWVRLAAVDEAGRVIEPGLYHRRWEIETTFRELKVTQRLEGSLRSRTPAGVRFEVAGHVLLYLGVRWLLAEAAAEAGLADPLRLSFQGALVELGDIWPQLRTSGEAHAAEVLLPRLRQRLASRGVPLRPGRHFPRPGHPTSKDKGPKRRRKKSHTKKLNAKKTAA